MILFFRDSNMFRHICKNWKSAVPPLVLIGLFFFVFEYSVNWSRIGIYQEYAGTKDFPAENIISWKPNYVEKKQKVVLPLNFNEILDHDTGLLLRWHQPLSESTIWRNCIEFAGGLTVIIGLFVFLTFYSFYEKREKTLKYKEEALENAKIEQGWIKKGLIEKHQKADSIIANAKIEAEKHKAAALEVMTREVNADLQELSDLASNFMKEYALCRIQRDNAIRNLEEKNTSRLERISNQKNPPTPKEIGEETARLKKKLAEIVQKKPAEWADFEMMYDDIGWSEPEASLIMETLQILKFPDDIWKN